MNVRYRVELNQTERAPTALVSGGKRAARTLKRAQILLAADAGVSDDDIAISVGVDLGMHHMSLRPEAPGRVLRREPDPAHRRGPHADPGRAGPARTLSISSSSWMPTGLGVRSSSPNGARQ
jgi:hypothetical protein